MYATAKDGQGYVQRIGEFEDIDEVQIRCGMFSDDVLISFSWVNDQEQEEK